MFLGFRVLYWSVEKSSKVRPDATLCVVQQVTHTKKSNGHTLEEFSTLQYSTRNPRNNEKKRNYRRFGGGNCVAIWPISWKILSFEWDAALKIFHKVHVFAKITHRNHFKLVRRIRKQQGIRHSNSVSQFFFTKRSNLYLLKQNRFIFIQMLKIKGTVSWLS